MKKNNIIIASVILVVAIIGIVIYLTFFRSYTVTFALKIGPGIPEVNVRKGELLSEPEIPKYDGYEFLGWYLDGELYDFSKPVNKDITLEAHWQKNKLLK